MRYTANPAEPKVCFIAYCNRESLHCQATFTISFYDQYGRPTPVTSVAFGLGWGDLLTAILLTFEIIAISSLACGTYYKYSLAYERLYGSRDRANLKKGAKPDASKANKIKQRGRR